VAARKLRRLSCTSSADACIECLSLNDVYQPR
jgi:hypothetical protein